MSKPELERQALAKGQPAIRQLVVGKLRLAQRSFKRRKEPRERLLVVPYMGATALARSLADMLTLPAP